VASVLLVLHHVTDLKWAHSDHKSRMLPLHQPARFLHLSTTELLNLTQSLAVHSQQTHTWCCISPHRVFALWIQNQCDFNSVTWIIQWRFWRL